MPTFAGLFCGAGGMDLGFLQAGFSPCFACDFDSDSVNTYRKNIHQSAVVADVRSLHGEDLGKPDVILGGPPCQGFSVAGKMDPKDPRSQMIWEFCRLVGEARPKAFVMENVKSIVTLSKFSYVLEELFKRFSEFGYHLTWKVHIASDYGVPQLRERVFFIGTTGRNRICEPTKSTPPTVRQVIDFLPPPGVGANLGACSAKITMLSKPVLRKSPYAGMLFNGRGRPINLDSFSNTLPASMGGNMTPIIDEDSLRLGTRPWVVDYHKRLRRGQPPETTTPDRLRRLSVTEAAIIQSFPTGYVFEGKQSSQFRQIGNAVPPMMALAIAKALLASLEKIQ